MDNRGAWKELGTRTNNVRCEMKNRISLLLNLTFDILICIMMTSAKCFMYLPMRTRVFMDNHGVESIFRSCDTSVTYVNEYSIMNASNAMRNLVMWPKAIHISFLNRNLALQMEKVSKDNFLAFINVDRKSCSMNQPSDEDTSACSTNYLNTLLRLLKMTRLTKVAVVSTLRGCRKSFAERLLATARSNSRLENATSAKELLFYRISNIDQVKNISDTIVDIKTQQTALIILIADHQTTSLIFLIGKHLGVNTHLFIWITIGLSSDELHGHMPWYVMDLRTPSNSNWGQKALKSALSSINYNLKDVFKQYESANRTAYMAFNKQVLPNIRCVIQTDVHIYLREVNSKNRQWAKSLSYCNGQLIVQRNVRNFINKFELPREYPQLKVVTVIDTPFTMLADYLYRHDDKTCEHGILCKSPVTNLLSSHGQRWNETCCIGMAMDILSLVATDLDFKPIVYIVEDGYYGGKNKTTGEWNGLIRDIHSNRADVAVAPLAPTPDRLRYVDFCEPFMEAHIGIMISTVRYTLSFLNMEFLKPLESDLRIWIFGTFIIGTILVYILENQRLALLRIIEPSAYPTYSWREGFTYFSGLTFQRDLGGKNPQRFGARVTAISFAFAMVIIMTTYTAVLTASKVSKETYNPFFGFKDKRILYPSTAYKYATVSDTGVESYYGHSENENLRRMHRFMLEHNVKETTEGIKMLKEGKLQAFIHGYPFLSYHLSKQKDCSLKIAETSKVHIGYSFSVPQNSPWKPLLSHSIIKLKEKEIIQQIYKKWFPPSNCSNQNAGSTGYTQVELKYFGGLILVLIIVIFIAIFLLGLEHLWFRHHRRIINPLQDKVQNWRDTRAAGRRNAFIDPQDIHKMKKLRKRNFLGRKKLISKDRKSPTVSEGSVISAAEDALIRMRMRRKKSTANGVVLQAVSRGSVISETEDELIRMRMRRKKSTANGRVSQAVSEGSVISEGEDELIRTRMRQKRSTANGRVSRAFSEGSVISETEDEFIRMRMRQQKSSANGRASLAFSEGSVISEGKYELMRMRMRQKNSTANGTVSQTFREVSSISDAEDELMRKSLRQVKSTASNNMSPIVLKRGIRSAAEDELICNQMNNIPRMGPLKTSLSHKGSLPNNSLLPSNNFEMLNVIHRNSCFSIASDYSQLHSSAFVTNKTNILKRVKSDSNAMGIEKMTITQQFEDWKRVAKKKQSAAKKNIDSLPLHEVWQLFESESLYPTSESDEEYKREKLTSVISNGTSETKKSSPKQRNGNVNEIFIDGTYGTEEIEEYKV